MSNLHHLDKCVKIHLIPILVIVGSWWTSRLELVVEFVVEGKMQAPENFLLAHL